MSAVTPYIRWTLFFSTVYCLKIHNSKKNTFSLAIMQSGSWNFENSYRGLQTIFTMKNSGMPRMPCYILYKRFLNVSALSVAVGLTNKIWYRISRATYMRMVTMEISCTHWRHVIFQHAQPVFLESNLIEKRKRFQHSEYQNKTFSTVTSNKPLPISVSTIWDTFYHKRVDFSGGERVVAILVASYIDFSKKRFLKIPTSKVFRERKWWWLGIVRFFLKLCSVIVRKKSNER